ncbi:zincin-like metallopeptidase domain-containing protein [uncultured Jannaschia sp.]|uniref:zincin-like metallopeptidase domain-containing protein n=1 Tax=uncultured Jannaschia sp. TaxID=293347 RepID=UPI00262FCE3C|nr:zincin-like metallopeptidase domain-containing protein [uncultured Jannaschia sp.]
MADHTGNLSSLPAIFPDQAAPIVLEGQNGRELVTMRWGMPSPAFALETRKTNSGVTNVRNCQRLDFAADHIENHAAYIQSWLKVLKSDSRFLFTAAAAAHAQRIVDYLVAEFEAGAKAVRKAA